jgi:hypothetical protein
MKVAVEILTMVADAGLIPQGKLVIGMGGTGRGTDTVTLAKAKNSGKFFDGRVDVIAKPKEW